MREHQMGTEDIRTAPYHGHGVILFGTDGNGIRLTADNGQGIAVGR